MSYINIAPCYACRFELANLDPSFFLMPIMKMRYTYTDEAF